MAAMESCEEAEEASRLRLSTIAELEVCLEQVRHQTLAGTGEHTKVAAGLQVRLA